MEKETKVFTGGKIPTDFFKEDATAKDIEKGAKSIGQKVWTGGHIPAGYFEGGAEKSKDDFFPENLPDGEVEGVKDNTQKILTDSKGVLDIPKVVIEPQTEADLAKLKKERDEALAGQKSAFDKLKDAFSNRLSKETKLEAERVDEGVPEWSDKLDVLRPQVAELQGQLDTLEIRRNNAFSKQDESLASRASIDAANKVTDREYDRKSAVVSAQLGAKAALMNAYQGNLTAARQMVEETVNAWTYDQQLKSQDLRDLITLNKDWFNTLDSEYQTELSYSRGKADKALITAREDLKFKLELQIDAAGQGVEIAMEDMATLSVEEATRLFVNKVAPELKDEDLTAVAGWKKEYDDAIKTGAIPANTTFTSYYATMTQFGTDSEVDKTEVEKLHDEYDEAIKSGAIEAGVTFTQFYSASVGLELKGLGGSSPTDIVNRWEEGEQISDDELTTIRDSVYSHEIGKVSPEISDILLGRLDNQFDKSCSNSKIVGLIQLYYRLRGTEGGQDVYESLESILSWSNLPEVQKQYARRMNSETLAAQKRYKKKHGLWARVKEGAISNLDQNTTSWTSWMSDDFSAGDKKTGGSSFDWGKVSENLKSPGRKLLDMFSRK